MAKLENLINQERLAAYHDELMQTVVAELLPKAESIAWADLKALRDGGKLTPGQYYRITDYVTTVGTSTDEQTGQQMVRSAGHPFDILVRADSVGTLNEQAWATRHEGDTYFQNARLEAWELKYCLDNDTDRFAWANTVEGKGVIYRMKDGNGNDLPYDFHNIQFRRYLIKGPLYQLSEYDTDDGYFGPILVWFQKEFATANVTNTKRLYSLAKFMHAYYGYYSEQYIYDDGYADSWDGLEMKDGGGRMFCCLSEEYDAYAIMAEVDTSKSCWCYTFGLRTALTVTETTDFSLSNPSNVHHNVMNGQRDSGKAILANNVFTLRLASLSVLYNTFEKVFRNNSFSGYVDHNSFSGYVDNNSFSGGVSGNSFSGGVNYNSFSGSVSGNSFSGYVDHNSFSGDVGYNSFSGYVDNNSFSGDANYNSFSGDANYNSFSGYVDHNSFLGYVGYNSFSGGVKYCFIHGDIQQCDVTTTAGASGTVKGLYTLGSISGDIISIMNNNQDVVYAATNSEGDLRTWNPADFV